MIFVHGGLLESFVAMGIEKQIGWNPTSPAMYPFRSHTGEDVDLALEQRSGTIAGFDVKSGSEIDRAYLDRWATTLGLTEIWQAILDRMRE